jgi:hypothetical protein
MSRHSLSEPMDGQIKLKCPRGHPVGVILVVGPRRPLGGPKDLYRLGAVLKAPKVEIQPDGEIKIESPVENFDYESRMEWGRTVEADCKTCGRPYWTFWETVEPEIAKLTDTPIVTLTLDDDPLC